MSNWNRLKLISNFLSLIILTGRFLVRPALNRMKAHRSYAIVYALLANAGQFQREAEQKAALSGVSATRASLCELLATKLLKEFTPRELVSNDAKSLFNFRLMFWHLVSGRSAGTLASVGQIIRPLAQNECRPLNWQFVPSRRNFSRAL